jgi:hypothetical protein
VLRFRLMVKQGPHMRPQASVGEAQHGLFAGLDVSVKETSVCIVDDAGRLALIDERDLWIDQETAAQTFGTRSIRCMPTTPIYWMLTLAKSTAVANGHGDAAPLNGFMFEQRAAVTS